MITPYYAQMRKIRMLLKREAITDVKVASVEEFQGQVRPCHMCTSVHALMRPRSVLQERRVIIVSTVRSSRELLSYDAKFTLGFVSNPRRFNGAYSECPSSARTSI